MIGNPMSVAYADITSAAKYPTAIIPAISNMPIRVIPAAFAEIIQEQLPTAITTRLYVQKQESMVLMPQARQRARPPYSSQAAR